MKPILYAANEVDFNHNGLGYLSETIFSQVTEERNGELELSVVYPVSGQLYGSISELMLLKVIPNSVDEAHVFRIYNTHLDTVAQTLTIDASSRSNDLGSNMIMDLDIVDSTAQAALDLMENMLVEPTNYNFVSDLTNTNSTRWTNRNPLSCIAGEEGSLLDLWGGEVKRGNNTIWLYQRRGRDNVSIVRHGKNLQGFTVEYSTKGMTTKVIPYFNQKVEDSSDTIVVYGTHVDSQYINNYPVAYIQAVDFSDDEEIVDLATLNAKAADYFTLNTGIDKPSVVAEMNMQDLSDSAEYEQFKDLENIELCDTITIYSKQHNVNLTAKVTKVVFDTITEKNVSLEVGSIRTDLLGSLGNQYKETIQDFTNGILQTIELAANGKNRVYRGVTEPISGMILNDVWYKPVGAGEIEMYIYDGAYWQKEAYSADSLVGTVNFGNINAINLNLSALTTSTITGAHMWLNLVTGEMQFTDPVSGDILILNQGEILFQNGTNIRRLRYSDEGLILEPGASNTGTAGNTSLILWGGDGSHKYIDFVNTDLDTTQRMVGINETIRFHTNEQVEFRKNDAYDGSADFNDVKALGFYVGDGGEGMWVDESNFTMVDGWNGVRLCVQGTSYLDVYSGGLEVYAPLYMNGYAIWDESDLTLKKNVKSVKFDAIAETKKQKVIEFEWDKKNPHNKHKPNGKQLGLSAQDAGVLQVPVEETKKGYLGIDLKKQITLNTLTNQALIADLEATKKELADLKALLVKKGMI